MKYREPTSFQERQLLQGRNINYSQFSELIPIPERTFGIYKAVYGSEPLIYFFTILGSDLPLGIKKRRFYDSYMKFHENRKDLIWESYINWNVLRDQEPEWLEDYEEPGEWKNVMY